MYPASFFHCVVSFGLQFTLLNKASVSLLTRLGSPKYVGAVEVALGLADADAEGDGVAFAVELALAEGDGVAFAVELALAEGLALADALGEAEVAGVVLPVGL